MSKYTNYEKVSQTYDSVRHATGVDTMTSILSGVLKKRPEEISMLEAGCGTGNYSLGFLRNGIGKLTMFDASEGMLGRAKEKVCDYDDQVKEIAQHRLPKMPYQDESFDVVTLIQVLHHLDTHHLNVNVDSLNITEKETGTELNGHARKMKKMEEAKGYPHDIKEFDEVNGSDGKLSEEIVMKKKSSADLSGDVPPRSYAEKYPNLALTIKEAYRVLKPNGVLLVDHSFRNNIDCSWISLAPKALALWKEAFIDGGDLLDVMRAELFQDIFCVTRPGSACSKEGMFINPTLILNDNWRRNLSEWSFPDRTGELPAILELVKQKQKDGTLTQFAYEQNRLFRTVGETTTVFARKY